MLAGPKGHDSPGRNHQRFTRLGIPSTTKPFLANFESTEIVNGDRLSILQEGLEEGKDPIQHNVGFFRGNPSLLMNPLGNVELSHPGHFPFGSKPFFSSSFR